MVFPLGDLQKTQIVPVVTYALIAINIVMFLIQQDKGDDFTLALAATPYEITHNEDIPDPVVPRVQEPVRDQFLAVSNWRSSGRIQENTFHVQSRSAGHC